jgi:hypothetical protein
LKLFTALLNLKNAKKRLSMGSELGQKREKKRGSAVHEVKTDKKR